MLPALKGCPLGLSVAGRYVPQNVLSRSSPFNSPTACPSALQLSSDVESLVRLDVAVPVHHNVSENWYGFIVVTTLYLAIL